MKDDNRELPYADGMHAHQLTDEEVLILTKWQLEIPICVARVLPQKIIRCVTLPSTRMVIQGNRVKVKITRGSILM